MKRTNKKGFTIVELVIVIAVIAILAAVLIPTFANVIDKANESSAMQAVRNAYMECEVVLAGTGRTLAEDTYFSDADGKYFFQLKGNGIEKVSTEPTDAVKKAYAVLENGVKLYGCKVESKVTTDSSNTKVMTFGDGSDTNIAEKTQVILSVYDSDGNLYYYEKASASGKSNNIRFSMFNTDMTGTTTTIWGNNTNMIISDKLQYCTNSADAKGWYSYTLTVGANTHTGVFYYDGIAN